MSFGTMLQAADSGLKFQEAPQLMKFLKLLKLMKNYNFYVTKF
jgi:hypothetical protein